jgi:predicted porin
MKEKFVNKKLIALAVAGALSAPLVASAQGTGVTIFGRVQAEYQSTDIDQTPGNNDYRQESISDNAGQSRWGLKINEDLGNGLSAIAQIEFAFRTGNGVTDSAREQWVGLSSKSWGTAKFGRVQSPFKDFAGGTTLDLFNSTTLQARGSGGALYAPGNGFGAGSHVDHGIRYDSPAFGGFSAAVLLVPSDATQADPTGVTGTVTTNGGNVGGKGGSNNFQIGLKYKFGTSGEIFGGYSQDDANDAQAAVITNGVNGDDEQVWKIGGAWNFGDFRIAGEYVSVDNALVGNGGTSCGGGASANGGSDAGISTSQCNTSLNANGEGDIWFLTAQYKLGKTTLVLQGGQTDADEVRTATGLHAAEREATNWTIGAIYNLSKRTRVYGGYQDVSVDGARNVANTTATGSTVLATQPDRSTWTIGVRHDF